LMAFALALVLLRTRAMDIRTNVETTSNRPLNFMSAGDRQLIIPDLKQVRLELRQALEMSRSSISISPTMALLRTLIK
jgi:hypothetical protein